MKYFLPNRFTTHNKSSSIRPAVGREGFKFTLSTCLAFIIGMCISISAFSQNPANIQGTVLDDKGLGIPGVSVVIKGTKSASGTDVNGKFSISARHGQTLVFSMIGFKPSEVVLGNQSAISVTLTASTSELDEVVVVGYGQQKKATLTGSVSTISSDEIVTTKNENVQNMLTGKIAGVRVVQNSSEPGSFDNSFDIRGLGSPLIVIDGVVRNNIARLSPNDIESISVLKDASAAIYGVKSANGVVLITTKKGKKGSLQLDYDGSYSVQTPSGLPKSVEIFDYMTLVNEKSIHNTGVGVMGALTYQPSDFEDYRTGKKIASNWNEAVLNDFAPQMQHDLSASGGNETTNYFASVGYQSQGSYFKTDDLRYKRFNLRSNLTTKLAKNLTFDLNLSGILDQKDQPYISAWYVFRSTWYQPPVQNIYANNNPAYFNNVPSALNGVAHSDSDVNGYMVLANKWFQSSASLNYEVPFIKGLSVKGLFSYDFNDNNNKIYMKQYNLYNYIAASDTYQPVIQQSPATVRREYYEFPSTLLQLSMNYAKTIGTDHHVSGLVLYEKNNRKADNFFAQRELSIAVDQLLAGNSLNQLGNMSSNQNNLFNNVTASYVGKFTYDYKAKYLAEFAFRADGSSKFATDQQWGFFPVGSVGYRLSEENFWKNSTLKFINNVKFRGSYGILGDDNSSTYQFISGYNYPGSGSPSGTPPGSVFDNTFISSVQSKGLPNPAISWYTAKTFDVGIDIEAWNGLFGVTFDYFVRNRTGLLTTQLATLPDVVGVGLPQENLNGDRSRGVDLEFSHRNQVGKLFYSIKGSMGITRTMNTTRVQALAGNSYLNWNNSTYTANRWNNLYWGYGSTGHYENYDAIKNSPMFVSKNTVVGDYRYEDWNGDGSINVDDNHPISTAGLPTLTYGLSLGAAYKGFDFNATVSGAGNVYVSHLEQLNTPLWAGGNALSQFLDRYHPLDPTADPYDPNTEWVPGYYAYTGTVPFTNTLANAQNAKYIRLKTIELGYSLPERLYSRIGIKGLRVFTNAYNLLTITNMKYADPEHPSTQWGYLYPLDKKFTFGVNLKL